MVRNARSPRALALIALATFVLLFMARSLLVPIMSPVVYTLSHRPPWR